MKRKIFACALAAILAVGSLTGCGKPEGKKKDNPPSPTPTPTAAPVDYENLYSGVLQEFYSLIKKAPQTNEIPDGKQGVYETAHYLGDKALGTIGYLLRDVNGDDVPELLIGLSGNAGNVYFGNEIYNVYTLKDDTPVFVLEGRSRNAYFLMEDNSFYNHGSNGAAYSIFGVYTLGKTADMVCREFYFSYHKNGDYNNIGFFHNTTGIYDTAAAEELNITDEEFWAIEDAFAKKTVSLSFTPFASLTFPDGPQPTGAPTSSALYGTWKCETKSVDGSRVILEVTLSSDGAARYTCGIKESEIMFDGTGTWKEDKTGNTITLDLLDAYEGGTMKSVYQWEYSGGTLSLSHKSGDPFLYQGEGKTLQFTK